MINKNSVAQLLGTAVLMGAAGMANAAAYTIDGGGLTLTTEPAFGGLFPIGTVAAAITVEGSGTVDDAGGIFNSAELTTIVTVTSPLDAALLQVITTTYDITDAAGNGTTTVDSCTENVGGTSCADFNIGVAAVIDPLDFGFDFSDLSNITWGTVSQSTSAGLGGIILETSIDYTATPSPVPLPAAAWLFGSALLGLAGMKRRNKS